MAYDFHYTPTGTGVISGKEVLEQTEDAINDLGNTAISGVQEALDKAEQALTNSENAVDDAQTALNTANNAEGVAIQAQNDVSNLSGTVTNIGNRVTTAEGNISNLQGRMTTAEGNIGNLQGRMTTAEGNIGNLQTAVSTAQATANSAQQTATTARQQSYVFRYSSTAVVPNSTIAYSTIDNTDNIKSGDKILDVDGKLFEITAVDTTNQTVTVGSALIDLALDANVMHLSGNESASGDKNFRGLLTTIPSSSLWPAVSNTSDDIKLLGRSVVHLEQISSGRLTDLSGGAWNVVELGTGVFFFRTNNGNDIRYKHLETGVVSRISLVSGTNRFIHDVSPNQDNTYDLGSNSLRWATFNGINPGALSLPDLNNGLDISGYINVNTISEYTTLSNGYISICGTASSTNTICVKDKNFDYAVTGRALTISSVATTYVLIPVLSNHTYEIICSAVTSIVYAKFYPCQGNV